MNGLIRNIAICILVATVSHAAGGFDLRVRIETERSRSAVAGLFPEATYPNGWTIAKGVWHPNDSVYRFKDLPDESIQVRYVIDGSQWAKDIPEPTDSITIRIPDVMLMQSLSEVTVQADRQYMTDDKSVYVPSRRDKKISSSGTRLLQAMAIPSLDVNPENNAVTTAAGEGVAIYIDHVPASKEEIAGMRTMDVARVEVFDYPKDPRFSGARHVVNFVMQKYEYGGYTRVGAAQTFVTDMGSYSVNSKMVCKRMTYDLAGAFNYSRDTHTGETSVTDYIFPDMHVTRDMATESSLDKQHGGNATFRALYRNGATVISNTAGIVITKTPGNFRRDATSFTPGVYPSDVSLTQSDNSGLSPSWEGYYMFTLPKEISLSLRPTASYGRYRRDYSFVSSGNSVTNHATDDAWQYNLSATMQKQFGNQSLGLSLSGGGNGNRMNYAGTNPAKVNTRFNFADVQLVGNLRFGKLWMQGNAGGSYSRTSINSLSKTEFYPRYFVAAGYNINDKNRISLASELSHWTIPMNEQGPNTVMLNQIDALRGGTDLKTSRYNSVLAQYDWIPAQKISFTLFGQFIRHTRPVSDLYFPMEGSATPVMVRSYVNSGFLNQWKYGGSVALRLIDGNLTCKLNVTGTSYNRRGVQEYRGDYLHLSAEATYSLGNFYFSGYYSHRNKSISAMYRNERPEYYYLMAGWGNGNLHISARANNFCRASWSGVRSLLVAENYRKETQLSGVTYHRWFEFSVSYSIPYGKKLSDRQDIQTPSGASSAILH